MKASFKKVTAILLFLTLIFQCTFAYAQSKENIKIDGLNFNICVDSKKVISNKITLSTKIDVPIKIQYYDNQLKAWQTVDSIKEKSTAVKITYPNIWQNYVQTFFRIVIPESKKTNKFVSPKISIVYKNKHNIPLTCKSAILIDAQTNQPLYAKEPEKMLPMASVTKLMTVLLILENCKISDVVTIPREVNSLDYNVLSLRAGEQYYVKDMLAAILLPSANEAAFSMAIHISGSTKEFIKLMNKRAKQLKMEHTHYNSTFGEHSVMHYTTTKDIAILHKKLLEFSQFKNIAHLQSYSMKAVNSTRKISYKTTNALLSQYPNMIAGKTGTNTPAKYCYTASITINSRVYILAILGSVSQSYRYDDARKLISYIEGNH